MKIQEEVFTLRSMWLGLAYLKDLLLCPETESQRDEVMFHIYIHLLARGTKAKYIADYQLLDARRGG